MSVFHQLEERGSDSDSLESAESGRRPESDDDLDPATLSQDDPRRYSERLVEFFQIVDPSRIIEAPDIIRRFVSAESMFDELQSQYAEVFASKYAQSNQHSILLWRVIP